ncbi:hypothetical protein AUC31_01010 [Planococcus rifietoensis]|uniref:Uncharacterized protein n=1 Tax=Planococcus rifietoensis TaxID=200991 RepID=A0A0U2N2Y7_9BACL|nr:hypothetical protein [Planococcus rifietoensis]ALS73913.1 hypothetical protein AUC31_01010 [Planococcus rifietoensis]
MKANPFYILSTSNGDDEKSWDFDTEEEAGNVYRAIINEFSKHVYLEENKENAAKGVTQLKIVETYLGELPVGVVASYASETWFAVDTYPKIVRWVFENIK